MSVRRQLLCIFVYVGLLGGAVIFVKQTVEEYIKAATSYTEEHKAVSLHDLPTIVICMDFERGAEGKVMSENLSLFPMLYGKDAIINVTVLEKDTVTLLKNQGVQTKLGLDIFLTELKVTQKWTCYKISTKWNGDVEIDINDFRMQLVFSFPTANISVWGNWFSKETGKMFQGLK